MKSSWSKKPLLLICALALAFALIGVQTFAAHAAVMCYVNWEAVGLGDGSSWENAYPDLQMALSDPLCGEIWVAAGTYTSTDTTARSWSFTVEESVALYGGFDGTEAARDDRNAALNVTILSGEIGDPGDVTDNSFHVVKTVGNATLDGFTITAGYAGGASPNNVGAGLYSTCTNTPEVQTLTLTNMIISGNIADHMYESGGYYYHDGSGGGAYIQSCSAIMTHVAFSDNSSVSSGGGLVHYLSAPTATMEDVTFNNNSTGGAWTGGGGAYLYSAGGIFTLTDVTFNGNSATGSGGGLLSDGASWALQLDNVIFHENSAGYSGGGMAGRGNLSHVIFDSNNSSGDGGGATLNSSTLADVTFNNNSAATVGGGLSGGGGNLSNIIFTANSAQDGGGMNVYNSGGSVTNAVFDGNTASRNGGGIHIYGWYIVTKVTFINNSAGDNGGGVYNTSLPNSASFANSTFVGNHATNGGGMYNYVSIPTLTNVTFSENTATSYGGGMANFDDTSGNPSNPTIKNSIFWGNTTDQVYNDEASLAYITYSVVQDWYTGIGNKFGDPKLGVLGDHGGFAPVIPILAGSSAMNAGQNSTCATDDQLGTSRPIGIACDMGAYEFGYLISGNTVTGGATIWYTDGKVKTVTADADGNFSLGVSYNWTGSLTPSKPGFIFLPASISYASSPVTSDIDKQNFTIADAYNISGSLGADGAGAVLNYTDGTPKTTYADSSGNYSLAVSYGWSGTVIPSKTGYTFQPPSRDYENMSADQTIDQDYKAITNTYTISGNAGVPEATITYTGGSKIADLNGDYSFQVSYGWSGTVTPSEPNYTFLPLKIIYLNVSTDKKYQDFKAEPKTYFISGNAGVGEATITYTGGVVTAGSGGSYSIECD